jgi:very-short-patch-repair endonuclease
MDLLSEIKRRGGTGHRADLVARYGRAALDRAIRDRRLIRIGPGRYALPSVAPSVRTAVAWGGIVSMRSAAEHHGWGQKLSPKLPDVTFPRTRHLTRAARKMLVPHWSHVGPDDVVDGVTGVRRTLIDCMRMLPLDESVPIVDSALRAGDVTAAELQRIASDMRGRGRARAIAVAAMATHKAANAFESTLRALASTVPGLNCVPQMPIRVGTRVRHPDLADHELGLIIEAESFEWHGESRQLTRDCARYNDFALLGWMVIRFSWSQVIFEPQYVLRVLSDAVVLARRHANVAGVADGHAA